MNNDGTKIITVDIGDEMEKAYLDYSMSVIVGRALPDVRDGLKPVHRRILYTMYENGLYSDKGFRKCADTVGSVLGRYHPHGDASVYDALVRMAQDFSLRHPLVKGQGNFGSIDGDPPAAYRYTESKMSKNAMLMVRDIDKDTVNFKPNYDDRHMEPVVLPAKFPNLLVNGSTGIAVGMATNMPPHNMGEVIDATINLIDNPEATMDELMDHIQGPDFPTGGIIMGRSGIRAAYATGRGKLVVRSRTHIEEFKQGREQIVITEIPYMVNKSRMVENIAELVKDKRVENISNIRDESNRHGLKVVIELKKDANAQVVLNQLFSFSQMQQTFGIINLSLVNGEPKVLTLKQILEEYVKFQVEIITRRTKFDLRKAKERAHILEGLKIALDYIDEVISMIRSSKDGAEAKEKLIERFDLSEIQANAIAQMRFIQLAGMERKKIEDELDGLIELIVELEAILNDNQKIYDIIKEELLEIKQKHTDPRRTDIETVTGDMDIEDLIPEEDCVVTLTHFGYIKRQPVDVYKCQHRGGRGVSGMARREEDFVEELFICSTHDYIMFFSNKGKVYRMKGYEIAESSRISRGNNVINLLPLEQDEKINAMIKVRDLEHDDNYLVMVTRHGIIKRTNLSQYKKVRKNGLIAINLDEEDELAWVRLTDGKRKLTVATRNGMAITFDENDARPLGRVARGVKAINLGKDDIVIGMCTMNEDHKILTVSESGLGRRTDLDEYRVQSRGGKGLRNYYVDKNGPVAGIRSISEEEDVIIITDDGVIIRIPADQISVQSRYAGGVRVMRLNNENKVVTLAVAPREEVSEQELDDKTEENIINDKELSESHVEDIVIPDIEK